MTRPVVTVYTRQNCGLCREAEAVVTELAEGRADVELIDIDIDTDEVMRDRYTVRVPVVAVNGEELFDFMVDAEVLAQVLDRA